MADQPWCRACGRESTEDGACAACGTPLDPPGPGPERGGLLRRRLPHRLAGASPAARRAAAIDLIGQGRPLPAELDLSEHEIAWYRAHAAATAGDLPEALEQLAKLPDTGYAARVGLLLSRFTDLLRARDCWPAAIAVLAPFVARSADAEAMVAALDRTAPDAPGVARRYLGAAPGDGPRARALAAYQRAVTGEADGVPDDLLRLLPAPLVDRLAVAGVLTEVPDGLPEPAGTRLRCRLGLAGPDEAAAAGFTGEAARRAYLAGDAEILDRLGDGPDVRHYRALHDYLATGRLREADLRPAARAVVRSADAVTVGFAGRRPVPDEVAADPTTWPRLWRNAVLGKLYPADGVARRHPRFALWLDLCGAYPALRGGDWPAALAIAERVAAEADDARLRGEARNVAAYAHWQLGRVDDALRELAGAPPGPGFAVNAVLVASSRGPAAALPHLAQVMRLAGEDGLRRAAVRQAADFAERTGQVPATLTAMIRAALVLPGDDELHQRLLALAVRHDRAWLASAGPAGRRPGDRYYRARAAYEEEPATAALTEVAAALAALWSRPGRPAWVEAEGGRLTGVLAGPPAGVDAAPAVERLADAGMLALADRIRLAAHAGARQILAPESSPRAGTPLVWAVEAYRQRGGELDPGDRAAIEALLTDRVREAVVTVCNTAIGHWNALEGRLTVLERSAARTWKENQPNMAARRRLIVDLRAHLERSERFLRLADGFPVPPKILQDVRAFHEKGWAAMPHLLRRVT
jgi:hypothetical protein